MPRYIALLRAINVGGHNVKMDRLRKLFEELGFADVETFIASGNVIFTSPNNDTRALEKKIEGHLKKSLEYEVATFIRTAAEIAKIAKYEPFPNEDIGTGSLYVTFLAEAPSKEAREKLEAFSNPVDEFHVHGRELYWLCRKQLSESRISGGMLEKAAGMAGTNRNVTTVRKLAARYSDDADSAK
ncbi:MAG: DUF1697 domain-containing protein [Chloroflexia bacterium]